jgi:hypothetical protein
LNQNIPEGNGSATRFAPTDEFLRRIHPTQWNSADDPVSSAAFTPEHMSVNWAAFSSVGDTLKGHEEYGVVSITAELCWRLGQQIECTPTEENPAHCDVVGRKTPKVRREFKNSAKWIRRPKIN